MLSQGVGHSFPAMALRPRPRTIPVRAIEPIDPEGWDRDPGRPLVLRLLALLGALSFLALGLNSLLPLLQRQGPAPQRTEPTEKPIATARLGPDPTH